MNRSGQLLRCLSGSAPPAGTCLPREFPSFHPHAPPTQQSFHTALPTHGGRKIKVRDTPPPGWQHSLDRSANRKSYNAAMSEYKEKVGALRVAWRTRVAQHNRVVRLLCGWQRSPAYMIHPRFSAVNDTSQHVKTILSSEPRGFCCHGDLCEGVLCRGHLLTATSWPSTECGEAFSRLIQSAVNHVVPQRWELV